MRDAAINSSPSNPSRIRKYSIFIEGLCLFLMLIIAIKQLIKVFPEIGAIDGDAFWTYMPNARKLLDSPWLFLTTDPASYTVAPLGYVWPAILGANQLYIQLANCLLFLISILLIWSFVRSFAGSLAALMAAGALIFHPAILYHIPQIMTESPYLFGFSLTVFSVGKLILDDKKRNRWLFLIFSGISITLLTRPVFQYIIYIFIAITIIKYFFDKKSYQLKKIILTLASTLIIPALVISKNGIYFDLWSIGTGSGSGLFYGLSPYKNGAEPILSNFSYDADVIPYEVKPETQGHPLYKVSDDLNKKAIIEIIKNTSLNDNVKFLVQKLHMWVFTSTPELYTQIAYRWLRLIEIMSIIIFVIMSSVFLIKNKNNKNYTGNIKKNNPLNIIYIFYGLLFTLSLMTAQLTLVLYNTRYSAYFTEPFYIILMSLSFGAIVSDKFFKKNKNIRLLTGIIIFTIITWIAYSWTQHAVRREIWEINSNRPGPSEIIIPSTQMKTIEFEGLDLIKKNQWLITAEPAKLKIIFNAENIPNSQTVRDAFWRTQFTFESSIKKIPSRCEKVMVDVTPHQDPTNWHLAPPILFLRANGKPHTYMISANGTSRPKSSELAEFHLIFNCPVGSKITFEGAEMRRSTLTEAAVKYFLNDTNIDPYLRDPLN